MSGGPSNTGISYMLSIFLNQFADPNDRDRALLDAPGEEKYLTIK